MPAKRTFSLRRYYGIFFLVLTVLLGCLFILQTADIYFSAMEARDAIRAQAAAEGWSEVDTAVAVKNIPIYSRQIAGERLGKLLPYVCIWLISLVGSIVIAIVQPAPVRNQRDSDVMLDEKLKANRKRLPEKAKAGQEESFALALSQYQHIHKQSRNLLIAVAAIAAVCLLFPFLYLADFSHFPNEDLNGEVIHAVLYALPFLLVLLAGSIVYVYVQHQMMKKENAALKAAIAAGERITPAPKKNTHLLLILRLVLLVVGVSLFILGTQDGSMHDVLVKATKICTECIGLG